jgi:hypothetical protein
MDEAFTVHGLRSAFTLSFHYSFPQLARGVVTGVPIKFQFGTDRERRGLQRGAGLRD